MIGNHPDAGHTIRNVEKYETAMEELRAVIAPELELIESRIVAPVQEYQTVLKTVRKTITKRDHKVGQASNCGHDECVAHRAVSLSSRIMTVTITR